MTTPATVAQLNINPDPCSPEMAQANWGQIIKVLGPIVPPPFPPIPGPGPSPPGPVPAPGPGAWPWNLLINYTNAARWAINTSATVNVLSDPDTDTGVTLSVYNAFYDGISGDDTLGWAGWNGFGWYLVNVEHITKSLFTGWRYDTGTHAFQRKLQPTNIVDQADETAFTANPDGTQPAETQPVGEVIWISPELSYTYDLATYVLEIGGNANQTIDTATSC